MTAAFQYSPPRVVENPEDCYFYHCFELPGLGTLGGDWDLRRCIDDYLGHYPFSGKRVLDVGTASGFLTFEMEKRGASVVSFDLEDGRQWNVVPHFLARDTREHTLEAHRRASNRLKNAYWFCHRRLGSQAQAYYGDIYALPDDLGRFDVAMFGMILSHLRDPFQALYSASRLADAVIITNQFFRCKSPSVRFDPDPQDRRQLQVWWQFSDRSIERMLGVLGFRVERVEMSYPRCLVREHEGEKRCAVFVARRVTSSDGVSAAVEPSTLSLSRLRGASWVSDRVRAIRRRIIRAIPGSA